jgi:hypothetical protein
MKQFKTQIYIHVSIRLSKIERFNYMCGNIKITLKYKTMMDNQMKFYTAMTMSGL